MYIKILFNYLLGYINLQIEGYFVEKLINTCISKGIFLWNINRTKSTTVYVNVSIRDFRKVVKIAKINKCKISIMKKKGLPFIFNKYKKRKIFVGILFLFIVFIVIMSNFIWNIEITGNDNITTEEIIKNLNECGLHLGMIKNKIDTKEIINNIRLKRNDIAWIGIKIKGTNAIVNIAEGKAKPEIINEEEYCNIVANKSGIVVKVNAGNGTPLVKEGDTIKEGTILIGGWLEGKYTGIRYVHANGTVMAKVWYSEKEKIALKQDIKEETGLTENKYSVEFNNFIINFNKTLSKFQNYETIEETKNSKIFSDYYLPIKIVKKTNIEYTLKQIQYTTEQAKEIGLINAKARLDDRIKNRENILNTYINYEETQEDCVEVEIIYEVLEEIGTKEKIVF